MKNYTLHKLLLARCGLILVSNQYGQRWLEIRWRGKQAFHVTLADPIAELKKRDRFHRGIRLKTAQYFGEF
jgi:hypothetical protein